MRPSQGDAAALSHLLTFLRGEGAIPAEKVSARRFTPVERCTEAYELYLRDVRGLAKATIVNYVPFVCCVSQGPLRRRNRHSVKPLRQ